MLVSAALMLGLVPIGLPSALAQTPEVVAEVRLHGNYRTPDADVLALAGMTIGQSIDEAGVAAVAERLRKSGRFQSVEIRKRIRSLTATDQVTLIIIVEEYPSTAKGGGIPNPLKRLGDSVMALPTVRYVDGYGLTYGARISFVQLLGKRGLVTVPLTWGGTRQATIEMDTTLNGGPFKRLRAGAGLISRSNPGFDLRDFRKTLWLDAATPAWKSTSISVRGAWSDVTFGSIRARVVLYGAGVTLDTRDNPVFPRNKIFASASWSGLSPAVGSVVNRYRLEARGYVGLIGTTVLCVSALLDTADRHVPDYEKPLLGGVDTLRGFRAGSFVGDNVAAASVELRIPLRSPMNAGQSGLAVFGDFGKTYDRGVHLSTAGSRQGFGVGWFFRAPVLQLGIDVAHGSGRGVRAHVTAGVRF
jgi:outer membrane protein assembly factor BamA